MKIKSLFLCLRVTSEHDISYGADDFNHKKKVRGAAKTCTRHK